MHRNSTTLNIFVILKLLVSDAKYRRYIIENVNKLEKNMNGSNIYITFRYENKVQK